MNKHSLIIGGTGMIAAATRWLAERCDTNLLVARHASAFAADKPKLTPLDLDWSAPDFENALTKAIKARPAFTDALIWHHKMPELMPWLQPLLPQATITLVLGHRDGPYSDAPPLIAVRLGSKAVDGDKRRWLTNDEISAGTIAALECGKTQIVGELIAGPAW